MSILVYFDSEFILKNVIKIDNEISLCFIHRHLTKIHFVLKLDLYRFQ